MLEDIRKLFKHTSIYAMGSILSKAIGFLMIPVYTRFLIPQDYGILELLSMTTEVISLFLGMGLTLAVLRFYYLYDEERERKEVISTALLSAMFAYGFAFALLISFSQGFSRLLFSTGRYSFYFKIVFINMFLASGIEIPLCFIRAKQRSMFFVALATVKLVSQLSLNIYFVVYLRMGILGILYSTLISSALMSLYLTSTTLKEVGLHYSIHKLLQMVAYGGPMVFSSLCAFILTFSDRYFLNHYCNLTDVGIYSLAYKFGMIMPALLIGPFGNIWSVQMFEIAKKEQAKEIFSKIFKYFGFVLLICGLAISLYIKDVLRIVSDPTYFSAYRFVPIIAFAYIIYGWFYVVQLGILIEKKTKYMALATATAAGSNIGLNFALIPHFGGMGAAWATVLSFIVRFSLVYLFSQKFYYVKYKWHKMGKALACAFVLFLIGTSVNTNSQVFSICFKTAILGFFPIILYAVGFFSANEKKVIIKFVKNPIAGMHAFSREG